MSVKETRKLVRDYAKTLNATVKTKVLKEHGTIFGFNAILTVTSKEQLNDLNILIKLEYLIKEGLNDDNLICAGAVEHVERLKRKYVKRKDFFDLLK